jgi:hypothetical protein
LGPAAWLVIEYLGPNWLSLTVLTYGLVQGWKTGLRLAGFKKYQPEDSEKAEKKRKMQHYFYHCELNPEGFVRLKLENFKYEAARRINEEAAELAAKRSGE